MKRASPRTILAPGTRIGALVVEGPVDSTGESQSLVRCDCGIRRQFPNWKLRSVRSAPSSCGCIGKERSRKSRIKHGLVVGGRANWHPLYARWLTMKSRCYNPNFPKYKDYGARGIVVCDRWRNNFQAFVEDMGLPPTPGMTLDRKDNDGPYCKANCKWSTPKEQANNRRLSNHPAHRAARAASGSG